MPRDPRLVVVSWHDAHAQTHSFDILKDHRPARMFTVGWLLKRDESGVTIANEREDTGDGWDYRGHTFIPSGMVVSVRSVRQS